MSLHPGLHMTSDVQVSTSAVDGSRKLPRVPYTIDASVQPITHYA